MAERNIPRAEDIFSGRTNKGGAAASNLFKNKKAPAPPSGPLKKIGNYQPKSLMAPTPGDVTHERIHVQVEPIIHRAHVEEPKPKPFIIGDKNIPLKIAQTEHDSVPVAPPRRKRRAPGAPDNEGEETQVSANPLFGRSMSNISDSDSMDFEEQGGVIDFGGAPRVGSGYDNKSNDFSNISTHGSIAPDYDDQSRDIDFGIGIDDAPLVSRRKNLPQNGDPALPYIPPPDYDDEEKTFDFDDEGPHVFKEFAGEDFGKYLDDDDDYRLQQRQRGMRATSGVLHTATTRPGPNPRLQGKKYKKKRKGSNSEAEKRNTIRDFTFTDTKIGWGDRTVKSTSAKGRYIKHQKERNAMDPKTHFNNPNNQRPSYEDFLLGKKDLDSPNSSDSGVDTGDHNRLRNGAGPRAPGGESNKAFVPDDKAASDIFHHSQPKQMRNDMDNYDHKDNLFKRLTWRFKKSVNISKR